MCADTVIVSGREVGWDRCLFMPIQQYYYPMHGHLQRHSTTSTVDGLIASGGGYVGHDFTVDGTGNSICANGSAYQ